MIVVAKVVKRDTEDGVEFFHEDVPIGAKYLAESLTRGPVEWGDTKTGKKTTRDSILIVGRHSERNRGRAIGYVPTELLSIDDATQ